MFLLQRTLEFRKDKDHKVKEDVGADVKENYVRYHLKDDDNEVWVINDFNRVSTGNFTQTLELLVKPITLTRPEVVPRIQQQSVVPNVFSPPCMGRDKSGWESMAKPFPGPPFLPSGISRPQTSDFSRGNTPLQAGKIVLAMSMSTQCF